MLYASLLLLHSAFFILFLIYDVNFTFSLHCSDSQLLLVFLTLLSQNHSSFSRSFYIRFPYNSLNLFTPLLILVHLLLIIGLRGVVIFAVVGLPPELCAFVVAAPAQQHTRRVGWSSPQSTSWRERPTKEQPNNNQKPITSRKPT